jgi:hypothetical protein
MKRWLENHHTLTLSPLVPRGCSREALESATGARPWAWVYKRYASLYFMLAVDDEENELIVLETIQHYVEILDRQGAVSPGAYTRPLFGSN